MAVNAIPAEHADIAAKRSASPIPVWSLAVLAVVVLLVATPMLFLVLGSFSAARLPADFSLSTLTVANYVKVWSDPGTYAVFVNTLVYAFGSAALGISIATILAWLVERTDMPCKTLVYIGVPLTLAMPGMLQTMAWVLLASPRIGFLNKAAMATFGLEAAPFDIYGMGGMIFVEGLRTVPTAFLMLVPLLRAMDPSLEEAARMSGAAPLSCFRRITLGLMVPGLLAVMIYQFTTALEGFEVPGILGLPAGTFVFSTKIYSALHSATTVPAYGEANALAMFYVVVAIISSYVYGRVISKSERYTVITGKGYQPRLSHLGGWRWPALGFTVLYIALSTIIPFLVLAYVSFIPYLQPPSLAAFSRMTLDNYVKVAHTDQLISTLWNTLTMTLAASTATVIVSAAISFVIVRSKFWGSRLLDQLAFFPHAIPGMAMGLALLWIYLQIDKLGTGLFGSIWAIVIAFTISYMAYGTRALNAAILQVHKDLEDAARMSGAPDWRVIARIFFPLLLPALGGVWIWTALHVVRVASLPLILADGPSNEVLAVLIWNMWDQGSVEVVGAIGTLLMVTLFAFTLGLQLLGIGRVARVAQGGR